MRDTSAWSLSPYTSKPVLEYEISNRYPAFNWRSGSTYYVISGLGEDAADAPSTITENRGDELSPRYQYGGFAVAGDSVTLDNGNVLRVTSRAALSLGSDVYYKYVTGTSGLTSVSTLSFSTAPRYTTGIGLADAGTNVARLFYISTGNLLRYRDYTVSSGWGSETNYTSSPSFTQDGVAVAPISGTEGFVLSYNSTRKQVRLYYFNGSTWVDRYVSLRINQHYLNCHWFDAEILSSTERLVTFCVNGIQYATIVTTGGNISDPWRVLAFDPEFGGVQTRICKLTKVGSRIIATAWSRFSGSTGEYEVSYYHLLWTDDGLNWAMPEEGYIGQVPCRGKLHTIGSSAYVIGTSTSYVGSAVQWLGGSSGVLTTLASNVTGNSLVQDIDQASDIKLPLLITDDFDKSLLQYGNQIVFRMGLSGEATKVDIAKLTLDTPNTQLHDSGQEMQVVCRGPLKKLIGFSVPLDLTIEGPWNEYANFLQGEVYGRFGTWTHDANTGVGYCETHDSGVAIATVGLEYSGQFQLNTRIRITTSDSGATGSVVFWYEDLDNYYRIDLVGDDNTVVLQEIVSGTTSALTSVSVTGGVIADKWYEVIVRYIGGILTVYIKPDGSSWQSAISYSSWTNAEPINWNAGVACVLPQTETTSTLEEEATNKILVGSVSGFPSSGYVNVNEEKISYDAKSTGQLGAGNAHSLVRGIGSERMSHPVGSKVIVSGRRFEVDYFSVFQDDRPMSVADACNYVSTIAGVPLTATSLVADSSAGIRVFPELHGHGWVLSGTYSTTLTLYFWTNTTNPPLSGYKIVASTTTITLSDIVSGIISTQPISIASSGTFVVRAIKDSIFLWVNGVFVCGIDLPEQVTFRVGSVACGADITYLETTELFEPAEAIVWSMQDTARNVLSRLLEGRDAYLRERSDGSIEVTHLEQRSDLGNFTGTYFVVYEQRSADQDWASAMVAWGGEDWILIIHPDADRIRWTQWQTPHIYDRVTLRDRAMRRLRKLWARKDLRAFQGPYDPRIEVGDELDISSIRGIPSGTYMVKTIEVSGGSTSLYMSVIVQALADSLSTVTWKETADPGTSVIPGVDRPGYGA